jgi:serine protease Do
MLSQRVHPVGLLIVLVVLSLACRLTSAEVADAVLQAEQARIAAIAKAKQASISVFANGGSGGGSGVVVTPDGYALSNFHVTKPAGNFMKCSMPDGHLYDAVIVGIDPTGDVALIKLFGRDDFPCAVLANSDEVRAGDWCFAIGNPFLLATDFQPTVTYGIVSGVHRYQYPAGTLLEYADCIQTDAAINPGNSGGPLFNAQGDLIGINGRGSFEKRGRVNVGVGYAISINQIKNFMGYLRSGRIVDHATLGATVSSDEDGRVVVGNILESSDAYRRGLRYGDELVSFGGRPIATVNGFKNVLGIYPKGWRVRLSFRRDGEKFDVFVRLAGVHGRDELTQKIQKKAQPPAPRPGDDGKKPQPDKKDGQPKAPPVPIPGLKAKAAPPKELAKYYVARSGYANYYFNQLNQDRIWQAYSALGDFSKLGEQWTLKGKLADGSKFEIVLSGNKLAARVAGVESLVKLDDDLLLGDQRGPEGTGGLLVALHLWRSMLVQGPKRFGEVYYLGTAPAPNQSDVVDVLIGTHRDVEGHFLFDGESGKLLALEMFPDLNVDPCEIRFGEYRSVGEQQVPHRIEVRHVGRVIATMQLEEIRFEAAPEPKA